MLTVDTDKLERDGFVRVGKVVSQENLDAFEAQIARFSEEQIAKFGLRRTAGEGFIDVFSRANPDEFCIAVVEPFEVLLLMEFEEPGDLVAVVNGASHPFTR